MIVYDDDNDNDNDDDDDDDTIHCNKYSICGSLPLLKE